MDFRWSHWAGVLIWGAAIFGANWQIRRKLPDADTFIFPLIALLSGWGMLTIWRLDAYFGLRQALWLAVSCAACIALLYVPRLFNSLRRYKYIWLISGLLLTGLTLLFGSNPLGGGPRLWLGCCGFYLQPSEPLKLLLVIYLSAYLADRPPFQKRFFPLIMPTLVVVGMALVILVVQRDLGTASIFIFLYTAILYLATGRRRVLIASAAGLVLAGLVGYFMVSVIQVRLTAWLNPWSDPSGIGYQVIQSLMAVANGGLEGRGIGMGAPGLVPVALSDFIYAAIAEETGLVGTFFLLGLFAILLTRSLKIALTASDNFRRLLAAGLTAYLGAQSVLIIGGNLRLLPLTGVTLPFVSYGGSSLVTSFIAAMLLLFISNREEDEPAPLENPAPYQHLAALLGITLLAIAFTNLWWAIWRADDLLTRSDNPRRAIADLYVQRGSLLDRRNNPIVTTSGQSGSLSRAYLYPALSSVTGYSSAPFGQGGLEFSLDAYLRGLQGNPALDVWWNHFLYGTPPPGLDVRLSLDLNLQQAADALMAGHKGALVVLNAENGEILVMSSHPTFDANTLDENGAALSVDPSAPLVNRGSQGRYLAGSMLKPFIKSAEIEKGGNLSVEEKIGNFNKLGFFQTPELLMPSAPASATGDEDKLRLSPLQLALAAATLSGNGVRPAPQIATAVDTPQSGWVILPSLSSPVTVFSAQTAEQLTQALTLGSNPYWSASGEGGAGQDYTGWFAGGTLPNWQGTPLVVIVALEGEAPSISTQIGEIMLETAIAP